MDSESFRRIHRLKHEFWHKYKTEPTHILFGRNAFHILIRLHQLNSPYTQNTSASMKIFGIPVIEAGDGMDANDIKCIIQ